MNLCSSPGEECSWNQGVEIKPTNLHITFDQCMCHSLKSLFVDKYISFQEICRQCWQASETLINHQYSELAKLTFVHVLFKHYPFFQKMIILQLWKCSVFCWTFCFTLLVKFNARAVFEFTSYHNDACCIMHWLTLVKSLTGSLRIFKDPQRPAKDPQGWGSFKDLWRIFKRSSKIFSC